MPARDGVTGAAQVLCQIHLHLRGGFIRHRVQVLVKFRQQADAESFHYRGGLDTGFVIGETFRWCQPRHAHINTRLVSITIRVRGPNCPHFANHGVKQHDINTMMCFGKLFGA